MLPYTLINSQIKNYQFTWAGNKRAFQRYHNFIFLQIFFCHTKLASQCKKLKTIKLNCKLFMEKQLSLASFVFWNILLIYFLREGKGGRKGWRETSVCGGLLVCRSALNPLSHTSLSFPLYFCKDLHCATLTGFQPSFFF